MDPLSVRRKNLWLEIQKIRVEVPEKYPDEYRERWRSSSDRALCCRGASATEGERFENDLDRQLEDGLSLEELMKHRQEPDKVCMVSLKGSFLIIRWAPWRVLHPACAFVGAGDPAAVTVQVSWCISHLRHHRSFNLQLANVTFSRKIKCEVTSAKTPEKRGLCLNMFHVANRWAIRSATVVEDTGRCEATLDVRSNNGWMKAWSPAKHALM